MGVQVGQIDTIDPTGDRMKVTLSYKNSFHVPANANASVLNPSLVASRSIQLSPPYTGGPLMKNGAVIPVERTQVPVEWDELRNSISGILSDLGPTPDQPAGPFGEVIESFADGLEGKGQQFNASLQALSEAVTTLNESRDDFFGIVRSLALFVNALHESDKQFVALNRDLASFTNKFTTTDRELADAVDDVDRLLARANQWFQDNSEVVIADVTNLEQATTALVQPEPRGGLETALHVIPHVAANLLNEAAVTTGGTLSYTVFPMFANPIQFICSAIQAGSRLGYQESSELCAQYLTPILDAIKFNFPPFGLNQFTTAMTLPKLIAYSEDRLRPPPGYKDTTVPGIFSRDTLFSHGNNEPGWIVAPGMQGVQVQELTAKMLTPESLAELMGGPDIVAPPAPPAFGVPPGGNLPGPPNSYDQRNPLPPPWYPPAPPVPPQPPGVSIEQPPAPAPVSRPN